VGEKMSFADTQIALGLYKPKKIDLVYARKHNLCMHCAKKGLKAKLDFFGDGYKTYQYTRYKVEVWVCSVCKKQDIRYFRIAGKGKSGVDSGSMFGTK
jgi:glycerate kinase